MKYNYYKLKLKKKDYNNDIIEDKEIYTAIEVFYYFIKINF